MINSLDHQSLISVERACAELRYGRGVLIRGSQGALLIAAIETVEAEVAQFLIEQNEEAAGLLLTSRRLSALGIMDDHQSESSIYRVSVSAPFNTLDGAQLLAYGRPDSASRSARRVISHAPELDDAAFALVRCAQLAPALLALEIDHNRTRLLNESLWTAELLEVEAAAVQRATVAPPRLKRGSDARIPLLNGIDTRFISYRGPAPSDEQVAVVIGEPDFDTPVKIRIHSACLTGDVFGSLRCDCGEQLNATIQRMSESGGGIILYLAQEGRGIGLVSKLRAYELQDAGADTYDANAHLGFGDDERRFDLAAIMLRDIGALKVRLLTNNPRKVDALAREGIEVVDRVALSGGLNQFNARYLKTKVSRGGHFDEATAESEGGLPVSPRDLAF